jgi:hypothetical protein
LVESKTKEISMKETVAMKRLATFFGIMMLATAIAIPAYAMGGGMGGGMAGGNEGGGMMGNWESGLLDWFQKWRNGSEYFTPSGVEKKQMKELDQQHDEDAAYLEYQIRMKEKQLDALLRSSDPDIQKVRALNRGIRELRAEADKEQRTYELEAGKITPGYRSGTRNDWSSYGAPGRSDIRGMGYGGGQREGYGSGNW